MPIRIEQGGNFVSFRDEKWTFGDRRRVLEAVTDWDALEIILGYVVEWNLQDVDGSPVAPKDHEGRAVPVMALAGLDDDVARWLVRAWFQAKAQRSEVPKA